MDLYNLLECEIKKMVLAFDHHSKGNIHPLIMQEIEKYILKIVLQETNYNYLRSSKLLGIGRNTLYRKIESLQIESPKK